MFPFIPLALGLLGVQTATNIYGTIKAKSAADEQYSNAASQRELALAYGEDASAQYQRLEEGKIRAQAAAEGLQTTGSVMDYLLALDASRDYNASKYKRTEQLNYSSKMQDLKSSQELNTIQGISSAFGSSAKLLGFLGNNYHEI